MLSKRIGNTIFTIFFDKKGKKSEGLLIVSLDEKGQEKAVDKICLSGCRELSDLLYSIGEARDV